MRKPAVGQLTVVLCIAEGLVELVRIALTGVKCAVRDGDIRARAQFIYPVNSAWLWHHGPI